MTIQALHEAIGSAGCAALHRHARFTLPGSEPPWRGTGIRLTAGQTYSLLAEGIIHWSRRNRDLYGGPGFHLWARVSPGGRVVNVVRGSGSFVSDGDGELELGIYLGMWRDDFGALDTPTEAYARLEGSIDVLVLAWRGADLPGLESLARAVSHPLIDDEIARLRAAVAPPAGWEYLREAGMSDIYRDCSEDERPRICLDAHDDQGIVRTPVDFPLQRDTVLSWRWKLDVLPSAVAEDSTLTHDYVSIAAEFDNGRDLTWMWSSALAPGHHFACPIPAWSERETHYVVRSGHDDTGGWCEDERRVFDDVKASMGTPPRQIVAVWLICVASFQHGRACAAFEDIRLRAGEGSLQVF